MWFSIAYLGALAVLLATVYEVVAHRLRHR